VSPAVYFVFVACLGADCSTVNERYQGPPLWCAMEVQSIGAKWIAEHKPGAQLRYWRCRMGHPA
jgi:hypothetical protein